MTTTHGYFITFEGGDGCGKSTQLRRTALWLQSQGYDVITTHEPGDTALGAEIRRLLLSGEHIPVPETELFLFLADRAQHVREVVMPALAKGQIVLCDRFSDSTKAYQLAGRKLSTPSSVLDALLSVAEIGQSPDITLWLDVPVDIGLARVRARANMGEKETRLDLESVAYHEDVRNAFAWIQSQNPERMQRIDATQDMDNVQAQIQQCLQVLLIQHD